MTSFTVLFFLSFLTSHQVLSKPANITQRRLQSLPYVSKHINHPDQDLIFDYSVEQNLTLFYALCDRNQENQSHYFRKQCAITLEQLDRVGHSQSKPKTCISELVSSMPDFEIPRKYRLERLGQNDLVFIWKEGENAEKVTVQYYSDEATLSGQPTELPYIEEKYVQEYLRVRIMHMDSCTYHETNITIDVMENLVNDHKFIDLNFSKHRDGVEINFKNDELCDIHRCKIIYNSKTLQFSDYEATDFWNSNKLPRHGYALSCDRTNGIIDCENGFYFSIDLKLQIEDIRLLQFKEFSNANEAILLIISGLGASDHFELNLLKIDMHDKKVVERSVVKNFECKNNGSRLDAGIFDKKGFEYCYFVNCVSPKPDSNQNEINLNDLHWYFHSFCLPFKNADNVAIEHHTN